MSVLQSLVVAYLFPMFLWGGVEEKTLKEVRVDMRTGYYHLATVRLERLLREYPKSTYRKEMLPLIIQSYVLSKREKEAIPHILAFIREFPVEATSLDPTYMNLVPAENQPLQLKALKAKPPSAVIGASNADARKKPENVPDSVIKKAEPVLSLEPVPALPADAGVLQSHPADVPSSNPAPEDKPVKPAEKESRSVMPEQAVPSEPIHTDNMQGAARIKTSAETQPLLSSGSGVELESMKTIHSPDELKPPEQGMAHSTPEVAPEIPPLPREYFTLSSAEIADSGKVAGIVGKLQESGLSPLVTESSKILKMHRLVTGCYSSSVVAAQKMKGLKGIGKGLFTVMEKKKCCVVAGSFKGESVAVHERKRLAGAGIKAQIIPFSMTVPVWKITVGWFPDVSTAQMARQRFLADGLIFEVLHKTG